MKTDNPQMTQIENEAPVAQSSRPANSAAVPVFEFITRWHAAIPADWDLEVQHVKATGFEACAGREIVFLPGDLVRGHGGPEEDVLQRMMAQSLIRVAQSL